ncbi:MAG: branched-chain amino acid ABC transporter permease [Actinomycetia bacterium]|nr:branched-chain amino acid ABC transporter permease [Actinomycetes bacterium]
MDTSTLLSRAGKWLYDNATIIILCVILLLFGAFFWWLNNPALEHLFITTCITLIFVMGLQLFMGNSGILAWSYIGFVGIGAFTSAICSMTPQLKELSVPIMYPWLQQIHMPLPLALLVGSLFAAAIAAIVAWPIMRLSGAVGVITHFALLIVINVLLVQWAQVTNGPRNFTVGMKPEVGFWAVLLSAMAIMIFTYFFKQSSLGLRLRASRDDRFSASTSGVNVVMVRYLAFIISCAIGAFGGGLMAHFIMDFTGHTFYMGEFFVILSMIVIGGPMSVSGVFFGLILVAAGRYGLRQFEPFMTSYGFNMTGTTEILLSILMILFLFWKASGISGGQELSLNTFTKWFKPKEKIGA